MDERLKLVKAAREMGAIKIEVDGIKVEFAAEELIAHTPLARAVPPNLEYLAKSGEPRADAAETIPEAGIRGSTNPDEFSRQTDLWANYQPMAR